MLYLIPGPPQAGSRRHSRRSSSGGSLPQLMVKRSHEDNSVDLHGGGKGCVKWAPDLGPAAKLEGGRSVC